MRDQAVAILWAQWRSFRNRFPRTDVAALLSVVVAVGWYGMWAAGAFSVSLLCRESNPAQLDEFLPAGLLLALLYWQLIPILMASTGWSIEMRKVVVYPVPHNQLFSLEILLRITAAMEMMIMVTGAMIGLLFNPRVPLGAPLLLLLFIFFNLSLSAGLRDLIGRLLARKRTREFVVLIFVLLAGLPQLIVMRGDPDAFRHLLAMAGPNEFLPWTGFAFAALGRHFVLALISALVWTTAAAIFGRSQFERNLRFDAAAAQSTVEKPGPNKPTFFEQLLQLPSILLPGQSGALIEKELRFLTRAPRFRLVFMMSFTFGLMVWIPFIFRPNHQPGALKGHFVTALMIYGVMLLSEVCVWNIFGFDRSAVQVYFAAPIPLRAVIRAKNAAAAILMAVDALIISAIAVVLPVPLKPTMILEGVAVTAVFATFLIATGNLFSVRNPRPIDASQSWRRSSAGRVQAFLLLIYLIVAMPVGLAYIAGYALDTEWAFYAVLMCDLVIAIIVYLVALDSAVSTAMNRKEDLISALSQMQGPVG